MGGTMTAEALPEASQLRRDDSQWPVPPEDGHTVDEFFTLHLPPHTELIDGSLVFESAAELSHAGDMSAGTGAAPARPRDRPAVWTYECDEVTKRYVSTGVHHDRLKLSDPYGIDIDPTAIDRL